MACPYLQGVDLYSCSATRDVYIPSRFELREYCTSAKYDYFRLCVSYSSAAWRAASQRAAERHEDTPS